MTDLGIRPSDAARYDGVSLGEIMLRLDPGDVPFHRARSARIWHGGGDSFVSGAAASLMKGNEIQTAVEWGAAHGICVQETPGDTTMVMQRDVEKEVKRALSGGGVAALR